MRIKRRATAALATALALSACGDEGARSPGSTTSAPPREAVRQTDPDSPARGEPEPGSRPNREATPPPQQDEPVATPASPPDPRDDDAAKRAQLGAAEAAYADYIAAINARDGARICELLPPDVLRDLRPPVERGGCERQLSASIGYRDPRGFPVWKETTLNGIEGTAIGRDLRSARLTAGIVTSFADRTEPSVESDVAYLERVAGRWRLAKPTGALYRAIGQPDIPPSVISPP